MGELVPLGSCLWWANSPTSPRQRGINTGSKLPSKVYFLKESTESIDIANNTHQIQLHQIAHDEGPYNTIHYIVAHRSVHLSSSSALDSSGLTVLQGGRLHWEWTHPRCRSGLRKYTRGIETGHERVA